MKDIQEDKVHTIYLDIQKQLLEMPRAGACRELDFFCELNGAIHSHLAASRAMLLTMPAEEQTTTEKYSRILFEGFQEWNEHYKNDPNKQFTLDEIEILGSNISEFLKTGVPELPEWACNDPPNLMTELCTILAFRSAKDAFDPELEFKDVESWLRACGRAFQAISPYIDKKDQERIFQMFQLTYPLTGTFQKNGGRFVMARNRGKYDITDINLHKHQDRKKNGNGGDTESTG